MKLLLEGELFVETTTKSMGGVIKPKEGVSIFYEETYTEEPWPTAT